MHEPIGLFGGTFDPVHFGHLRAALEARNKLGLDRLHLLPSGTPPHRSTTFAEAHHRLAMLRLAISGIDCFAVDDREIRREGYSYMVDTLSEIRTERSTAPILLLIGQDAANDLDSWHQWQRLFELAHLVILRRPGSVASESVHVSEEINRRLVAGRDELFSAPGGYVFPLDVTQLEISSTGIRADLVSGNSPRFLMPDRVLEYIREHRLYQL